MLKTVRTLGLAVVLVLAGSALGGMQPRPHSVMAGVQQVLAPVTRHVVLRAQSNYINGMPTCDLAFEQINGWNAMQTDPNMFIEVIGQAQTGDTIPGTSWSIVNVWGFEGGMYWTFNCVCTDC